MKKIDKEVQRIIREYKLTPSKLLFVEDIKQEEINTWFENIKEDLINYIHCSLKLKDEESHDFKYWYTINGYAKIDDYNFRKGTAIISNENLYKKWRKKINPLIL